MSQGPKAPAPADRGRLVVTEVDVDQTSVGGPAELVEAVLRAPELEAWPVRPGEELTHDGDWEDR
ncbi:hypothetical protein [Blastococcus sp. TF02A-35]|uniref:hypothetical protein n=1 Tax=Blastococcus sp. TF02A-35 TaxID=2559612 RepID=UPI0010737484|nr:hypothetical protein [Blastococcus sp. TF02A_35]TFV51996.1 hypothetical protein E4P43_08090 [Blastococcus sp. TF02A_35]